MMKLLCPDSRCSGSKVGMISRRIIRKGSYYRRSDGQWLKRYRCLYCAKQFSSGTRNACYRQKKRTLNRPLDQLLTSGVSQRRAAILLRLNRKTVVRKFRFLASEARTEQAAWLQKQWSTKLLESVQFDDLETSEHTKCKPLSVTLAVEPRTRKILAFEVARMPAKGHLAHISWKKYGPRPDQRPEAWDALFRSLRPIVHPQAVWLSDQNPHYPRFLKKHHPEATHLTTPGARGSIGGQGELKKLGHDPLFALNHTCAMLRANLNRLFRRTWCTTKTLQGLIDHLSLYVRYHNEFLTPPVN